MVLGLLLSGCITTTEPLSEKKNPAKVDDTIKIIYSDPNQIYIMANISQLAWEPHLYSVRPEKEFLKTALNHCSIYKKNAYHIWKKAMPIPYKFDKMLLDKTYSLEYSLSRKDLYDWSTFRYQGQIYMGYRFVCANHEIDSMQINTGPKIIWDNYSRAFKYHHGTYNQIKKIRYISDYEVAEIKRKELEEKERIAKLEKQRRIVLIESLEKEYGYICSKSDDNDKFKKGTKEYGDCLIRTDQAAIAKAREKDELRKKKKIELDKKLAAMTPTERHAYNCSETFNFKKGTEKFNDCVFKLYTAELDIQKLELEKQVAEANAKAASNEQLRAESLAKAQIASANASTRAANLNSSMQLMKLSEQLIRGNQQQNPFNQNNARFRTTCSNVGGFLTCF